MCSSDLREGYFLTLDAPYPHRYMDNEPEKKYGHGEGREEVKNPDMLDQPVRGARRNHGGYITSNTLFVNISRYALPMP